MYLHVHLSVINGVILFIRSMCMFAIFTVCEVGGLAALETKLTSFSCKTAAVLQTSSNTTAMCFSLELRGIISSGKKAVSFWHSVFVAFGTL